MNKKQFFKPTKEQIQNAKGKTLKDVVKPGLRILFVGINPGLYTAAIGHHFGRPGNRFWPALRDGGLTPRLFSPFEEEELLDLGIGITNVFDKATATAAEVNEKEFKKGSEALRAKIERYQPKVVAFLGIGAYRVGFNKPKAKVGKQKERIGSAIVWALPNPSGLNANYQAKDYARLFKALKQDAS